MLGFEVDRMSTRRGVVLVGSSAVDAACTHHVTWLYTGGEVEEGGWVEVGGASYGLEGGCCSAAPPDLHQICYRW